MLDLFNIPTPQSANYQEFYGGQTGATEGGSRTWIKPRGVSMVRFMLIGAGGVGVNGTSAAGGGGGGSGAVTSWIGPAMFVPDSLLIAVGLGGISGGASGGTTNILYPRSGDSLLSASGGTSNTGGGVSPGSGGTAMTANQFTACGIFTSIAGQAGASGSATGAGGNISGSNTTFLTGGAGGSGANGSAAGSVAPNYGYTALASVTGNTKGRDGYFITQPILVGAGGAGGGTTTSAGGAGGRGGIGCGGGGAGEDSSSGGRGGDGAVFIWAW